MLFQWRGIEIADFFSMYPIMKNITFVVISAQHIKHLIPTLVDFVTQQIMLPKTVFESTLI